MKNELSVLLKELRKAKGQSQETVSKFLGITNSAYSNYEQGTRQPDYDTLKKIAIYFNVTTDYLLGLKNKDGTKTNNFEEQPIQLSARSKDNKVKQFTLTQKELEEIIANAIKINNLKE